MKIDVQIDFMRRIWDSLGERLQLHESEILDLLQARLVKATKDLNRVASVEVSQEGSKQDKRLRAKRLRFVVALKDCLQETVDELENWHTRFDPSWWLILRLNNHSIDEQLSSTSLGRQGSLSMLRALRSELSAQENANSPGEYGFLHPTVMFSERETIIGSTATLACPRISQKYVVVDPVSCTESVGPVVTESDVLGLARILAKIDPSCFGLLRCHGAIKHQDSGEDPSAYDLLLDAPSNATAFRSLRDALESTLSEYPLNERIEIAVGTARAVSFLHAFHFVHKNIRPENIIIFRSGSLKLGNPFLVCFERFRKEDTDSFRFGDVIWQKNLYRHPQRQGEWPHEKIHHET